MPDRLELQITKSSSRAMQSEPTTPGPAVSSPAFAGPERIPLFHAAWLFAAGIVLTQAGWLRPSGGVIALALVAALCCIAAFRALRIVWIPVAVLWCLLGVWCAEMEPHPAPAPAVIALSAVVLRTGGAKERSPRPFGRETVENMDEPAIDGPSQRIDLRVSSIEF